MSIKSVILVFFQIVAMVYLVIWNNPITHGIGLVLQIAGLILGLWGILTIKLGNFNIQPEVKSVELITSGPYRWIRNPMYIAVLLFYIPIITQNFNWLNLLVFILLIVTLLFKINSEEQYLEEQFGTDYLQYKSETKRLIPFLF